MPFSVVQTIEKGELRLTAVPDLWIHNKLLFWPKKSADKLRRRESSAPDASWQIMTCDVKRKNLKTFQEAQYEIETMSDKSDTEIDEGDTNRIMIDPIPNNQPSPTPNVITDAEGVLYEVVSEGTGVPTTTSYEPFEIQEATQQSLVTHSDHILEAINNIYEIQQHIMQNQDKIMKKLAEMSVQIEELDNNRQPQSATLPLRQDKSIEMESFMIRAINDIENLEKLERELKNKEIFEKLRQQYSIVCSESRENGINCAYRLLDLVFTKEFLCKCSWTGGSRNAVDVKIGFKAFKNVIHFFFTLVNSWDATYTMEDNEKFFKTVLRNAMKRKEMKNIRSSAKKRRVTVKRNKENQQREDDEMINEENEESLC